MSDATVLLQKWNTSATPISYYSVLQFNFFMKNFIPPRCKLQKPHVVSALIPSVCLFSCLLSFIVSVVSVVPFAKMKMA